jgi:diketogulonate reductase-like aldo/keto reductase
MKYETVQDVTLPKIGFGAWSIGGDSYADPSRDAASLAALRSALEIGYKHFDTAEAYAAGHSEDLIGQAIRDTNTGREDLFITTKVSPEHLKYNDVLRSCENSLRHLGMEYVDLYLIHWPGTWTNYEETFRALNKLVRGGKVRHLGVSNFKLKQLKKAQEFSGTPIITNQVPYRIPDLTYVQNGVIEYCQQNDVLITAYSPVKFRMVRVNKILNAIAQAHSATSFQIALAWLVMQPRVITIPMSFNPEHIRENFEAADIDLTQEEFQALNAIS